MSGMDGARREIQKLRLKLAERDFRAGAPPVDEDGLPNWDGSEPLSAEAFMKALGCALDEELTEAELETRHRLAPFASVFARLQRDENAGGEDVK